jgi:hypothetical protein
MEIAPPISNVFAGPNTDNISGTANRTDGIHFDTYAGQIEFANAWNGVNDALLVLVIVPLLVLDGVLV